MTERRRPWLLLACGALVVLLLTYLGARAHGVSGAEADAFRVVNDAPEWAYRALWPVMQLGNVLVAGAVALLLGICSRRWRLALVGVVACVAAWYIAKAVKGVVGRERPAGLLSDVHLPGLNETGYGFISGHSTVAFTLATVAAGALPRRWRLVPFVLATLVALARISAGVHLPLDVVGGAAAGIAIGSLANAALVEAGDQSVATSPTGQATPVPPNPQ